MAGVESFIRACAAVPELSALVSEVIADAVATPDEFVAPNAGSLKVSVPSSVPVSASPTLVGCVPVRIAQVPAPAPASSESTIASPASWRTALASLIAIVVPHFAVGGGWWLGVKILSGSTGSCGGVGVCLAPAFLTSLVPDCDGKFQWLASPALGPINSTAPTATGGTFSIKSQTVKSAFVTHPCSSSLG